MLRARTERMCVFRSGWLYFRLLRPAQPLTRFVGTHPQVWQFRHPEFRANHGDNLDLIKVSLS